MLLHRPEEKEVTGARHEDKVTPQLAVPEEERVVNDEEGRRVRVRWHSYDGERARMEWLLMPEELRYGSIHRMAAWIDAHLTEREGLLADSHEANAGERVLWFEWDLIR